MASQKIGRKRRRSARERARKLLSLGARSNMWGQILNAYGRKEEARVANGRATMLYRLYRQEGGWK
jgi:hypothetical protein